MRPTISIITVVYNGARHLEQTIQSVLGQAYRDLEYVVVDGGSTDGTIDVIKKYAPRLSRWVSEPDGGIYDAMNKGISMSSGEVIGIINADDWYCPAVVPDIAAIFTDHPDVAIVHGDLALASEPDGHVSVLCPEIDYHRLTVRPVLLHPTCFIRRDAYHSFGTFNVRYLMAADYELLLRMYLGGAKFHYRHRLIATMREGGASDRLALRSVAEVKDIRILHGTPPMRAVADYWAECLLLKLRGMLNQVGLRRMIYWRRSRISASIVKRNTGLR